MRLTVLAWLVVLARLTIYCNRSVLSLPPSLISDAASSRPHQLQAINYWQALDDQKLHRLWKKDTQHLASSSTFQERALEDVHDDLDNTHQRPTRNGQNNNIKRAGIKATNAHNQHIKSQTEQQQQQHIAEKDNLELNGKSSGKFDLNTLLEAGSLNIPTQTSSPQFRTVQASVPFTPLKYWARLCQRDKNCPTAYYRTLLADRGKAAALKDRWQDLKSNDNGDYTAAMHTLAYNEGDITSDESLFDDDYLDNDVLLMLTGENDLIIFLKWAMSNLYPHQEFMNRTLNVNLADSSADNYHPGMYLWRKTNLSGRLEPKLFVEEPHYVISRPQIWPGNFMSEKIPFIPPRGRKHDNLPDLDALLLNRYDTFVPNRGRRDKIKDILKYDDLFYPNRGKRGIGETIKYTFDCSDVNNCEFEGNAAWPLSIIQPNKMLGMLKKAHQEQIQQRQLQNYLQQRLRQQQQQNQYMPKYIEKLSAIYNSHNNDAPQEMSMYKTNGYDQSVKSSMPSVFAAKKILTAPTAIKNSPLWQQIQQQTLQQHRSQPMMMMIAENEADGDDAANSLQLLTTAQAMRSMSTIEKQQEQHPDVFSEEIQQDLRHEQSLQDHQLKSLTNFKPIVDQAQSAPLLWRQLQMLKQKMMTMQQAQLPVEQHFLEAQQYPLTPDHIKGENSQETQLAADGNKPLDLIYFMNV